MDFVLSFIILLFFFLMIKKYFFKDENPNPSNGAIIMAVGIFLIGAAHRFPLLSDRYGDVLAAALLAMAVIIAASFIKVAIDGEFHNQFIKPKIKCFAIGTWVAGTSVLGNVLLQQFPESRHILILLAVCNGALWVFYLSIVIKQFKEMYASNLYKKVHGILLLSTVSTQSIVILYFNVFAGQIPLMWSKLVIYLGIIFYILGFILIVKRYKSFSKWEITDDWQNTNCIIHGAMSITGLAAATTGAVSESLTLFVWLWVLTWFVIVELVELCRGTARIRKYGLNKAIGQYNATQWSRNFTFGMLYAFTMQFDLSQTHFADITSLVSVREFILSVGAWIVLIFLINEILLWLKAKVEWKSISLVKKREMQKNMPQVTNKN